MPIRIRTQGTLSLLRQTVVLLGRHKYLQKMWTDVMNVIGIAGPILTEASRNIERQELQVQRLSRMRDESDMISGVVAESYESRIAEVHEEYSQYV